VNQAPLDPRKVRAVEAGHHSQIFKRPGPAVVGLPSAQPEGADRLAQVIIVHPIATPWQPDTLWVGAVA
jgi:hypothetical protein